MAEPTLQTIFGAGASQTSTQIIINKADLPGLTPAANNRADQLLVGVLLRAQVGLPKTAFENDIDQSIYIELGYPTFAFRGTNNAQYRVDQLTINLAKPDTSSIIDPDDY